MWSILPELLKNRLCSKNTHFPYLLLMLEPWTVKTTVAMGAWLNIVMTQELCWKCIEVRFQSLFSSVFLFFIQWWSEVKCTNSSGHMAQEPSFSKSKVSSLTTMIQSLSVLLVHSCLYHSPASPRVRIAWYAKCWVIGTFPGLKARSPASWTSTLVVRPVSKSS